MKVHAIIMHTGYVESSSTGCLILWHPKGFDTVEDALKSLGAAFLDIWNREHEEARRRSEYKWNRCPHCDKSMFVDKPATDEDIAERVRLAQTGDCDGAGELHEGLWAHYWQIGIHNDMPREYLTNAVLIFESADSPIGAYATDEFGGLNPDAETSNIGVPEGMKLWNETEEE
jgi:hypothetical protein